MESLNIRNEGCPKCDFLQKLPAEVRIHIYRKLPYGSVLVMREVCKQAKEDIDEHINFHAKIDQSYRRFRQLFRFRLRSCTINHLKQQNSLRNIQVYHPILMKKIIFDGEITATNLYKILWHYRTIERLVFTHETLGIVNLLRSQRMQACLRTLTSITHLNLQYLRYPLSDPFDTEINVKSFLETTFPNLASFKLYFSVWGNWLPLLLFLQRHALTLRDLELQVGDRGDSKNTEIYLQTYPHSRIKKDLNLQLLKRIKLRELRFRDDVLHLNPSVKSIFMDIIAEQKDLSIFQFHSPGDITLEILQRIVKQNSTSLNEVAVYNLKNNYPQPQYNNIIPPPQRIVLDMLIFESCKSLKTLALSGSSHNNHNQGDVTEIKMINLDRIPLAIERLHLSGFQFNSDDMIKLSRRSPNLKEVLIVDAGFMTYSTVLLNILTNCDKLEYLNVRPVKSRVNGDDNWYSEVNKLSVLYNRFMGTIYDPIDDLDGFEATVTSEDREWIKKNLSTSTDITWHTGYEQYNGLLAI